LVFLHPWQIFRRRRDTGGKFTAINGNIWKDVTTGGTDMAGAPRKYLLE
jgi:hypothetical protein